MLIKEKEQKMIVVTGDVTMDWNLAREWDNASDSWSADSCSESVRFLV